MEKKDLLAAIGIPVILVGFVIGAQAIGSGHSFLADVAGALDTSASSTPPADTGSPTLTDVLRQIQEQQVFLTRELAALETKLNKQFATTTRDLKRGESGPDVAAIQTALAAQDPNASSTDAITPTGYFGRATEQAVRAFQDAQGLPVTGIVDGDTRDALLGPSPDNSTQTFDFKPIDLSTVANLDNQSTFDWMQGQISQLQIDSTSAQSTIADLESQVSDLSSQVSDLQANASAPAPAPATAPTLTLSTIQAGSITNSAATITWTTNNPANSKVNYSVNSTLLSAKSVSNTTQVTSHSMNVTGLAGNTVYYYQVVSTDTYGNTKASATLSFTTTH